jgi:DNA processing protein
LKLPAVSIVGTRRASEHALAASRAFARAFGQAGLCVISGLAFGVDACSHRGALDAKAKTIAVVGSGIDDDSLYPRANLRLANEIIRSGGLIVSENPPGTKPQNWDFPKRNRIIAALSAATVVVEAPVKSGALITAKFALELGREVYVVPADALRESGRGSNGLLASGATPLLGADGLISAVFPGLVRNGKFDRKTIKPHNQEEAALLAALASGSKHVDDLVAAAGLTAAAAQASLAKLELCGAVANLGNMRWGLTRSAI